MFVFVYSLKAWLLQQHNNHTSYKQCKHHLTHCYTKIVYQPKQQNPLSSHCFNCCLMLPEILSSMATLLQVWYTNSTKLYIATVQTKAKPIILSWHSSIVTKIFTESHYHTAGKQLTWALHSNIPVVCAIVSRSTVGAPGEMCLPSSTIHIAHKYWPSPSAIVCIMMIYCTCSEQYYYYKL